MSLLFGCEIPLSERSGCLLLEFFLTGGQFVHFFQRFERFSHQGISKIAWRGMWWETRYRQREDTNKLIFKFVVFSLLRENSREEEAFTPEVCAADVAPTVQTF